MQYFHFFGMLIAVTLFMMPLRLLHLAWRKKIISTFMTSMHFPRRKIEKTAKMIAESAGATAEVNIPPAGVPVTYNDQS